jgi:RND superfamily putative drug exporter
MEPGRTSPLAGRVTKWLVLALWLVLAAVLSPLASKLSGAEKNDVSSWLPRSSETTQALNRAQQAFPGSDRLVAVVVYTRDGSRLTDADTAKVNADRASFIPYAQGGQITQPEPSADGQALLVSFPMAGDDDAQSKAIKAMKDTIAANQPPGMKAALTGPAGAVADITDAFGGLDTTLILVTAGVVAVLLLITYRSPVLWLVPLLSVGIASQAASAVVYLLAKHAGLTVNGQSQGIMTVLVFGAGTDYALLLIARYREELHRHRDRHTAMAVAFRRSFPAILASGATVTIGLLCLLAAQMNNIRGLGPVAAIGIVAAFAAMTTLLPALLVICGRWLFWPFVPRVRAATAGAQPEPVFGVGEHPPISTAEHDVVEQHGFWGRIARSVSRRPKTFTVGTAAGLAVLAFGMLGIQTGLTDADQYTKPVGSVTGQGYINQHYPRGSAAPADVVATAGTADQVAAAAKVAGIQQVLPVRISADQRWADIQVVFADPPSSPAAEATLARLRTAVHAVPGAQALVGGQTASQVDINAANRHDARTVMPLILAVVFLVLMLLLRSLVAPLLLVASVVLSYAAALGTATVIYHAIGYPRIDQGLPLLAFLFLVALGVDYTIFMMTRAREETAKVGTKAGVTQALAVTGGVITSAGFVLAATFCVLAVLPLVEMLQMGLVVALGVLLDTLVVRTLLVPALAIAVGRRVWWPGRLARALPPGEVAAAAADQAASLSGTGAVRETAGR